MNKKGFWIIGTIIVIGGIAVFVMTHRPPTSPAVPHSSETSSVAQPLWATGPNSTEVSPTSSLAPQRTNDQIISDLRKLREMLAEARQAEKHRGNKANRRKLRENIRGLERDMRRDLEGSEVARRELVHLITDERETQSKKELSKLLHTLDPAVRAPLEMDFAKSSVPEDRKVGIAGLASLRTRGSLDVLVDTGEHDKLPNLRADAVLAIGQSVLFSTAQDSQYRASAQEALRSFIKPENQPTVREAAYRAFGLQPNLSPEDRKLLINAAQRETDPKLRVAAEFAARVSDPSHPRGYHPAGTGE